MSWQPNASQYVLIERANFLREIRSFFYARDVLEVDTPLLSHYTVTDQHLDPFEAQFDFDQSGQPIQLYLQTSPEFHMKRLLSAGSGAIYYLGKAFRNEAAGRNHNPEFTMLEWYRPGFDDQQLMAEVDQLMQLLLGCQPAIKMSYRQAFMNYLEVDPLDCSLVELKALIATKNKDEWLQNESNVDTLLQWLFSMYIEPNLGNGEAPVFVYDFPASQAALAKINQLDSRIAHRFELYYKGKELANGYFELQDALEQNNRFKLDNELRKKNGKSERTPDKHLLAALESGLPSCAGVALGFDRLLMLKLGKSSINEVLTFDVNRA